MDPQYLYILETDLRLWRKLNDHLTGSPYFTGEKSKSQRSQPLAPGRHLMGRETAWGWQHSQHMTSSLWMPTPSDSQGLTVFSPALSPLLAYPVCSQTYLVSWNCTLRKGEQFGFCDGCLITINTIKYNNQVKFKITNIIWVSPGGFPFWAIHSSLKAEWGFINSQPLIELLLLGPVIISPVVVLKEPCFGRGWSIPKCLLC